MSVCGLSRKVDVRLPGKGNSNSHGARPVHLVITIIEWIRTSRLSIKDSLCLWRFRGGLVLKAHRLLYHSTLGLREIKRERELTAMGLRSRRSPRQDTPGVRYGVEGLGLRVQDLGCRVWGLGFGVWGLGLGVWGLGFGVWSLGFGVWG